MMKPAVEPEPARAKKNENTSNHVGALVRSVDFSGGKLAAPSAGRVPLAREHAAEWSVDAVSRSPGRPQGNRGNRVKRTRAELWNRFRSPI